MLDIRKFKPIDMFPVIKLASDTLTERYNPSLFNYFYETFPTGFIVADMAHKIIGFLIGVKITSEKAKILMLSVSENYRKQNIGSKLLTRFMEEMEIEKVRNLELEVRTDNKKAIEFYTKHGFNIKQKINDFYQNGESAYTMVKNI